MQARRKIADPEGLRAMREMAGQVVTLPTAKTGPVDRRGALHRAQILSPQQFGALQKTVLDGENPERDLVGLLLSYYCGLRAQEIAYLEWDRHILDPRGGFRQRVTTDGVLEYVIFISGDIGKRGKERTLPAPDKLIEALRALRAKRPSDAYVFHRLDGLPGPLKANSAAQWFKRLYMDKGYVGCSSHSGRRTFGTTALRRAALTGCSIRDVMDLLGHNSMSSTQAYAEPSPQQGVMVASLYDETPLRQTA